MRIRVERRRVLDVLRQFALFYAAYSVYGLVRGAVDDQSGAATAFENARHLITLERGLHVFVEPAVNQWAQSRPWIVDGAGWIYLNAQTTVTVAALAFIYLFPNQRFYFVRNMFMIAMALALVGYAVYPTAPPRFFPEWGFVDSVSGLVGIDHEDRVNALFNPYAAVPSMHVCFSSMIGLTLSQLVRRRVFKVLWACYPLLVVFVIVSTANHFLADAVLGAITAGASAWGAARVARMRPDVWAFRPAATVA